MTSSPATLHLPAHRLKLAITALVILTASFCPSCLVNLFSIGTPVEAQTTEGRAMTLRSDVQEANAKTGVVTARGNVQINYPARQVQATAAQAQYFSRERRIVLSGNVYVLQEGNSMRGETITYLIDEGRFVALPAPPVKLNPSTLFPTQVLPRLGLRQPHLLLAPNQSFLLPLLPNPLMCGYKPHRLQQPLSHQVDVDPQFGKIISL
jgi:lipopolysaccharide export system protein LptA